MTTLPAVVRIVDLPVGTTITGAELWEVVQTSGGVGLSVQLPVTAIMTTSLGALPTGGNTAQILNKTSATNFAATWSGITSFVSVNTASALVTSGTGTAVVIGIPSGGITSTQIANNAVGTNQLASSLGIASSLSIGTILTVGGTATFNGTAIFNSTAIFSGTTVFSAGINVTGTALITGTLGVVGTAQFTGSHNIFGTTIVTGIFGVVGTSLFTSGSFGVVGTSLFTSGAFGVVGTTLVTGIVGVVGSALVTGSFGVVGTSQFTGLVNVLGTALITGTFGNVGTATFTSNAFNVVGTASFTSGAFNVNATTNFTAGAFNIIGTTNITGIVNVVGSATFTGGRFGVNATSNFTGIVNIVGTTNITGAFNQNGTSMMTGVFGVVGTATFTGVFNVVGTTNITGLVTLSTYTAGVLVSSSTGVISNQGGMVLLNTLSPSAVASTNDTTSLTGAYRNYFIALENVCPATNTTNLQLQLATSGSNFIAASYFSQAFVFNVAASFSTSVILLSGATATSSVGTSTVNGVSGFFYLFGPSSTNTKKRITGVTSYTIAAAADSTTTVGLATLGGNYDGTTAPVTGVNFLFSSGNIATGIIRIYGMT